MDSKTRMLFGGCCRKNPGQFMDELMVLLSKSEGRDKVNKALQFATKLVIWAYELEMASWHRRGKIPVEGFASRQSTIAQMERVHTSLGQARKVFRFFKFYQGYVSFISFFTNNKQPKKLDLPQLLSLFCTLSMANYLACDNMAWALKVGLFTERKSNKLTFTADAFSRWSNLSWLHALLVSILLDVLEIVQSRKNEAALRQKIANTQREVEDQRQEQSEGGEITVASETKDETAALSRSLDELCKKRTNAYLNIVKNACDVGLATSSLKYWSPNNGILGLCGVISAVIGAFQMWPSA